VALGIGLSGRDIDKRYDPDTAKFLRIREGCDLSGGPGLHRSPKSSRLTLLGSRLSDCPWVGNICPNHSRTVVECLSVSNSRPEGQKMIAQFFLFVVAVLLISIFWELTKINDCLKTLLSQSKQNDEWAKKRAA
jgi:hypothetical protein